MGGYRYITVPEPFEIVDPITAEPTGEMIPFGKSIRAMCIGIGQKGKMDALSLLDMRMKLCDAKAGDVVELPDEWWTPLADEFRRPSALMTPQWLFSARTHILAVTTAPAVKPVAVAGAHGHANADTRPDN